MKWKEQINLHLPIFAKKKGGVNVPIALVIYGIFLCLVLLSFITIKFNKNNNTKYWEENSENKANCQAYLKIAYNDSRNRRNRRYSGRNM